MALLRDRNTEPVKITFSATPPHAGDKDSIDAYNELIEAHVLSCTKTELGDLCQPGPAGDGLVQSGAAEIALIAGHWAPDNVLNISRAGSAATAEVRMKFEASPLYRDFQSAFDQIQISSGRAPVEASNQSKVLRASYQRYEDGWHLESVD